MKKKMVAVLLAVVLSMMLTACTGKADSDKENESKISEDTGENAGEGKKEGIDESKEAGGAEESGKYMKDFDADEYVTLGNYKGVEISLEEPTVTEDYLEGYIEYVLQNSAIATPVEDRPVEMGDVVNIDYIGKLDGVAFEGGSAEGFDLTIGSGQFIDGFEDGCIGMEIGETKDVEATFPDPYTNNPDLAGKVAVFTVTVNSISVTEVPELTDEYVQSLGLEECSNVEEYRSYLYDVLLEQEKESYEADKADLAYQTVAAGCEFKDAPEGIVSRMNDTLVSNLTSYAGMYGVDLGTYVANVYGGTKENYEETLLKQSQMMAQHYLMMQAIADKEGLTVSEEELEEEIAKEAAEYGYETAEEYRNLIDVEAFREYLLTQKVLDFLAENAVVVSAE